MRTKFPIHTTLSAEAIKILERYEKELGAKNTVLEKALLAMGGKKPLGEESIYLNGKLKTGIVELDEMLFGGFLKGTIVEVTGPPGSGKSLLTALIVIKHIEKYEKQCAIISFDGIKETVEATNLLGMEMGKCIGDYFLDVIQGRADIVDIYNLLKGMPSIIVFDDIRTLGYDSISSLMSSGEWRLMSNIIKEQDTVCIIVGNDGDDNTSSSCGTVIRMGRIAGTDGQLH